MTQRRLAPALGLAAAGVALGLMAQSGLLPQMEPGGTQRGLEIYQSAGVRWPVWTFGAKLIAQAPWSGWGYGSFEATLLHQYMTARALDPSMTMLTPNLDHPHNELIYWGVEGGLLPLLGLLLMGVAVLWRACQVPWRQTLALLALVAPIVLHTQTEYPLYHAVALWWTLLLLVHTIDAEVEEQQPARGGWRSYLHRSHLLLRALAVLIPLVVLPFMATTLHTAWLVTKVQRSGGIEALDHLDRIVNPLPWVGRLQLMLQPMQLRNSMALNDKEGMAAYVDWAQEFVRHTPRYVVYANLAAALEGLGQHEQAKDIQKTISLLYPTVKPAGPKASEAGGS